MALKAQDSLSSHTANSTIRWFPVPGEKTQK